MQLDELRIRLNDIVAFDAEQWNKIAALLHEGIDLKVNVQNKLEIDVDEMKIMCGFRDNYGNRVDNRALCVSDFEVSIPGIDSNKITSITLPRLSYTDTELLSVDITYIPFLPPSFTLWSKKQHKEEPDVEPKVEYKPESELEKPKWTVRYNIPGDWIGSGWEFFKTEKAAQTRFDELGKTDYCGTKRPYCHEVDRKHLGACHEALRSGIMQEEALNKEIETLRSQLAGCGVASLSNTFDSLRRLSDVHEDYVTASFKDCINAVAREMLYREIAKDLWTILEGTDKIFHDFSDDSFIKDHIARSYKRRHELMESSNGHSLVVTDIAKERFQQLIKKETNLDVSL